MYNRDLFKGRICDIFYCMFHVNNWSTQPISRRLCSGILKDPLDTFYVLWVLFLIVKRKPWLGIMAFAIFYCAHMPRKIPKQREGIEFCRSRKIPSLCFEILRGICAQKKMANPYYIQMVVRWQSKSFFRNKACRACTTRLPFSPAHERWWAVCIYHN